MVTIFALTAKLLRPFIKKDGTDIPTFLKVKVEIKARFPMICMSFTYKPVTVTTITVGRNIEKKN